MHLSPREQEKLLIVVAADLARRRQAHLQFGGYVTAESYVGCTDRACVPNARVLETTITS